MEHSQKTEAPAKMATMDHSKMDQGSMKHEDNPSMGMEGHEAVSKQDLGRSFFFALWPVL